MNPIAQRWFEDRTFSTENFPLPVLLAAKAELGVSISVVIPARNESETVAGVVAEIDAGLVNPGLVDELIVIDSDSDDDTAGTAAAAGAKVFAARDIDTGLASVPGKGEALWRSLFVTTGDIVVFIDADLTEWGTHFVSGLLGPLLSPGGADIGLVKGFYDRLLDDLAVPGEALSDAPLPQGGRVTELVARPLLNLYWPELAAVVQPLAGEWAIRRSLAEQLRFPVGYGIEFATLTDTAARSGIDAVAQVDLGRRGHRHQNVHDLGVMAAEILSTAMRRLKPDSEPPPDAQLYQYQRSRPDRWRTRQVPVLERPPARTLARYGAV